MEFLDQLFPAFLPILTRFGFNKTAELYSEADFGNWYADMAGDEGTLYMADSAGTLTAINTGTACNPCDVNCDGSVNQLDIQPFVQAVLSHSACSPCGGDANGDGSINQFDIQAFTECLAR